MIRDDLDGEVSDNINVDGEVSDNITGDDKLSGHVNVFGWNICRYVEATGLGNFFCSKPVELISMGGFRITEKTKLFFPGIYTLDGGCLLEYSGK